VNFCLFHLGRINKPDRIIDQLLYIQEEPMTLDELRTKRATLRAFTTAPRTVAELQTGDERFSTL
jgi:hypothetical protein